MCLNKKKHDIPNHRSNSDGMNDNFVNNIHNKICTYLELKGMKVINKLLKKQTCNNGSGVE